MVLPFPYQLRNFESQIEQSEIRELKELLTVRKLLDDWHTALPRDRSVTAERVEALPRLLERLTRSINLLSDAKKHEEMIKKKAKAVIAAATRLYEARHGKTNAEASVLGIEEGISHRIDKVIKLVEEAEAYCVEARKNRAFIDPIHVWDGLIIKAWRELVDIIEAIRYLLALERWLEKQ